MTAAQVSQYAGIATSAFVLSGWAAFAVALWIEALYDNHSKPKFAVAEALMFASVVPALVCIILAIIHKVRSRER